MTTTRRTFMKYSAGLAGAALAGSWAPQASAAMRVHLGACQTSLRAKDEDPFPIAKRIGLDGVELWAGDAADALEIATPEYQAGLKKSMAATGVIAPSIMMGILNRCPLATDPRAPAWLEQTIGAAHALGCKTILVAFFGEGDLRQKDGQLKMHEFELAAERVKAAAPFAKESGVTLGLENTLSAKDNLKLLGRIQHDAVKVYYDVGNSTRNGYDVPAEIRELGDRICAFHFKDPGADYIGEGEVKFQPIADAMRAIDYQGWVCLETKVIKDRDADFRKNAAYARKVLGLA